MSRFPEKKQWDDNNFTDQKIVTKYDSYNKKYDSISPLKLEGLKSFTKTFEFDAEIPFSNPDFSKVGKDLSQYDQKKLEQKALNYIEKLIRSIQNKSDEDFYWKTMYDKMYLDCLANYKNQQEIDDYINNSQLVLDTPNLFFAPLKDYKLSFYNQNRIVALESTSPDLNKKESQFYSFK